MDDPEGGRPWRGGGVTLLTCVGHFLDLFNDRCEVPRQLGELLESIKDHFPQELVRYYRIVSTLCWSIQRGSGRSLGPPLTTF